MLKRILNFSCLTGLMLVLASIGSTVLAQSVKGTVRDESNAPLPGVSVVVVGKSTGAVTDANGAFSVRTGNGTHQLRFSFIGYGTVTKSVTVSGSDASLNLTLAATTDALSEVVVVGSRSAQRTLIDNPLPVDILSAADLKSTGQTTFDKALQYRIPSFNTVNTPVNDATSLLDPWEIRNMGPSRSLVLINGKRKNSSSLIYIQTSPGRGESGADISAIPADAIKRVEILRDGASAQYGSDAIAGVINIILKDRFDYGSATLRTGVTSKGDGGMFGIALNNGANFGEKGFINYTLDFSRVGLANRPGTVDAQGDANDFGAPLADVQKFLALKPDAGNVNGSPETTAAKFSINGGVPLGTSAELYYNAAYVYKKVNSFANYRTPYWRTTDDDLLHVAGTPYIGYVPTFEGDLNDYNGTVGIRSTKNGWKSDVSFTTGGNNMLFTVSNSRNRGLGKNSPTVFKPGGFDFSHNVGNIDITKQLNEKISLGFGSEFRAETFAVIAGDTASYATSPGADSFPGFSASNAKKNTRYNFGGYVDMGIDITKDFLINGTFRTEQYSDFGTTNVFKLSSRYKLAGDKIVLRASYSTGFRAPSLQQIYQQLSQASFVPGQGIQIKGIVNNVSPQAFALGVPKLKAEESTNFTMGIGVNPSKNFSMTLDYYNIQVKDRIILSSNISKGGTAQSATLDKILDASGIVGVSFFVNGLNTSTSGLDFVTSYRNIPMGVGKLGLNFAGNYTIANEKVGEALSPSLIKGAGQSIIDATQEALLLTSRPKFKAILGADYKIGKISFNLNNTMFGPSTFRQDGLSSHLKTVFETKIVTDLGANIELFKNATLALNINNLLNVMPKWNLVALDSDGEKVLSNPQAVKDNINAITFNGRYSNVTYDGSHFSQLGTTFSAALSIRF